MVPVYLIPASGNQIITFDDPSQDQDLGVTFVASLQTLQRTMVAWTEFRWHVQEAFVTNSATVTVTPITDGRAAATTVMATRGMVGTTRMEFPLFNFGTRLASLVQVTAHSGLCELGSHEIVFIPRRHQYSYTP